MEINSFYVFILIVLYFYTDFIYFYLLFLENKYSWTYSKYECSLNKVDLELQVGYSPGFSLVKMGIQESYSAFSKTITKMGSA